MASIGDLVFDSGLDHLDTEGDRLDITSEEATTYAGATSTHTLGNKTPLTISAPGDKGGGGREVTISAIADGTVTGTASATHWAISDDGSSVLLCTGVLASAQSVTSGNTFTLTEFKVGIPDPA
jgi:hypothetical protein